MASAHIVLKRFSVIFHVLCDGWNKAFLSSRNGICFTVFFSIVRSCMCKVCPESGRCVAC